ncbi:hypothetical protein Micbo1qcDRAFT_207749 [Microdochium bolleyi]|uniref:Uncharacterized protein n=1 Tax=Microdochium bolleyi TaxID=196109 RepID=A0A136ISZ6_9PEZI|nr:hypothetical protein Micbo1qcDRAFT_207749 [Microdochium bolleyi]
MATYTLSVQLDAKWRRRWEKFPDMRLCFSTAVASGSKNYSNVVATTSKLGSTINISWKDEYMIAGSDTEFDHGAKFDISSDKIQALLGSVTTLSQGWEIESELSDRAPEASFVFNTKRISAAAVLYKKVNGSFKPIYVSHIGALPPQSWETLTPKLKVYVWFSSEYEDATMIDQLEVQCKEIDMTGRTTAVIRYDADGNWVIPKPDQ